MSIDTCPKCGSPRVPGPECPKCGVIYVRAEQLAYQEKRQDRQGQHAVRSRLIPCAACGKEISKTAPSCPHCGEVINPAEKIKPWIGVKQGVGILGAGVILVGSFLPLVSVPLYGSMNYFRNGKGDGVVVVILAVLSLGAVLFKKYLMPLISGAVTLAMLAYSYWSLAAKISETKISMAKDMAGNPFGGLAMATVDAVQLQWGWAVLIIGALLLISSAVYPEK